MAPALPAHPRPLHTLATPLPLTFPPQSSIAKHQSLPAATARLGVEGSGPHATALGPDPAAALATHPPFGRVGWRPAQQGASRPAWRGCQHLTHHPADRGDRPSCRLVLHQPCKGAMQCGATLPGAGPAPRLSLPRQQAAPSAQHEQRLTLAPPAPEQPQPAHDWHESDQWTVVQQ